MASKKRTVLSDKFELVGDAALDARKRVSIAKALSSLNRHLPKASGAIENGDVRFTIHMNKAGQILLSPHVLHPEEAWLYKNPKALASVRRGLKQLADGKRYNLGSFAQYLDDEID
jgi:hypothetical protein